MSELKEAVGHGLAMRVDVRHHVVLTFRTEDDLGVVLEEIHLKNTNITKILIKYKHLQNINKKHPQNSIKK